MQWVNDLYFALGGGFAALAMRGAVEILDPVAIERANTWGHVGFAAVAAVVCCALAARR